MNDSYSMGQHIELPLSFFPYSASKISLYDTCPRKFKFKYMEKIPVEKEEFGLALEKGKYIHHVLEHYPFKPPKFEFQYSTKEDINRYQLTLRKVISDVYVNSLLRSKGNEKELSFFINDTWGFAEKSTYLRGYIDLIVFDNDSVLIIDWKTGKKYGFDDNQINLYALIGFLVAKEKGLPINSVKCLYYYTQTLEYITKTFTLEDLDSLKEFLRQKIDHIEGDFLFEKNVNKNCGYCDYYNICKPYNLKMEKVNANI